ncbi:CPBP family intramembrane glutamic endopeptidase [Fructobacillus ficulneus]|uniref:CAAX amino terminal protease family protein n=1 Tax=Fructobacillus ficulneus TaxID=157463 RepID=A0A0K8MJ25_9LACO|nr:CPBP family intramembrane glutamic endopeptidase [Fructobacillus ficulneus]GAO99889.1 CAAX amino terminal protease family protein [Fructobacillus ficulneus]
MRDEHSETIQRLQLTRTFILNLAAFIGFFAFEYITMVFIQGSILFTGRQRYEMLGIGLILAYCFVRYGLQAISGKKFRRRVGVKFTWRKIVGSVEKVNWPVASQFKTIIGAYIIGWSGMVIWNQIDIIFFYKLNKGTTENQNAIDSLLHTGGTYSLVMFSLLIVFLGPVMEEILFRGLFFRYFKSEKFPWLVVVLSGLIFGIYHLSSYTWISLLDLPPYAIIGFALAYVRYKTDKLSSSIIMHIFHNGWIQVLSLLMMIH